MGRMICGRARDRIRLLPIMALQLLIPMVRPPDNAWLESFSIIPPDGQRYGPWGWAFNDTMSRSSDLQIDTGNSARPTECSAWTAREDRWYVGRSGVRGSGGAGRPKLHAGLRRRIVANSAVVRIGLSLAQESDHGYRSRRSALTHTAHPARISPCTYFSPIRS